MANQTVKDAIYIKGTNPQYLVEKIIRTRIYDCRYWKEECFALTAELLVDKAMELKSIGGVFGGNGKPSSFLCLILKMLQIQPEKEIIIEFIRNEDFKYVRALGAFYMRLTGASVDVYKYLEPLYIDYRKMKRMNKNAKYELIHMDEFIDELLNSDRVCDVALPRLQKRHVLEELNEIEPRISPLDVNLDDVESSSSSGESEEDEDGSSSKSELESGEEKEKSRDNKKRNSSRKHSDDDQEKISNTRKKSKETSSSSSGNKSSRFKYTDYDNPNEEDEIKRYKRSPSPKHARSKRRSRSRSREDYRSSSKRDNERERDRDRDRRDREKRSRTRSRDRKDRKRSEHNERSHKSDAGRESDRDRKPKDKPKSRNQGRS